MGAERDALEQLATAMARNSYLAQITSNIMIMLPKEVSDQYLKLLEEEDESAPRSKKAYLEVSATMKACLANIDQQIEALVSN